MARHVGMPGRTLLLAVVGLVMVPVATGLGVYLLLGAVSPVLRIAAPIAGLWAFATVLRSRPFEKELVAKARGAIGETTVGRALHRLPTGWRVFHDVQLDGENIDHVAVSSRGVFTIESKNYSGRIKVGPAGLYTHGERDDKTVRQAWRQAHRLRNLLGVDVQPVLVFVGRDFGTTRVGTLPVMTADALVPYLLRRSEPTLDLEIGRRVFTVLESLVAGRPRPTTARTQEIDLGAQPMELRTSMSHPLQVVWIPHLPTTGALGMTCALGMRGPSGSRIQWVRDLDTDLARLRSVHRADLLISLMERHEFGLLDVPDLLERAAAAGFDVHHFPMPAASVTPPAGAVAFGALVAGIRSALDGGKRVVLQCRDGYGRSGWVAAVVAATFAGSAEVAMERVRSVQPAAIATSDQEAYVRRWTAKRL
jgi:hypothetical protein